MSYILANGSPIALVGLRDGLTQNFRQFYDPINPNKLFYPRTKATAIVSRPRNYAAMDKEQCELGDIVPEKYFATYTGYYRYQTVKTV